VYISERNKCDRKSNLERLYLVPGRRTFALSITARSVEDETRNAELNGNRNPECWGDFSQRQIQIQQKSHFEFVPRDSSKFKSNQNLNSTLYRDPLHRIEILIEILSKKKSFRPKSATP